MSEWITKELALTTLASHFDVFLRIADLLTCTADAKRLPENRFFAASEYSTSTHIAPFLKTRFIAK